MPSVKVNEQSIYYAARGDRGAPLVFVHGAGGSHLIWNGQLAALADLARAYALDLPGHGRSTGAGRQSIRDYAIVVRDVLAALGLERAVIAGHSMGGAIAQTLALEFPDRVLGLALVGTGARLRVAPAFLEGLREDFAATAHQIVEYSFAPGAAEDLKRQSKEQLLACNPQVVYGDFAACNAFDALARLGEIHAPTLVLCGAEDKMTPLKYSEYLVAHIANACLETVPEAGHYVMLEQPAQVKRALLTFMRGFE